jgi:hypothetical protein
MNRHTFSQFARVFAIAAVCVVALSAATVKQIHPQIGGANAPVRIAILADHYTSAQEQQFDYDVENLIKYGLLADVTYTTHAASMHVASYFDATPANQASRFDFEIGLGDGQCAVKAPDDILSKLSGATAGATVLPTHFVVLGNHPYNIGCTRGNWSYVAVDAVGTDVLQHELGHLVGLLFDEWAMPDYAGASHPGLISDQFNCAPKPGTPYWMGNIAKFPLAGTLDGCDLYNSGVVHAYHDCRMGAMNHRQFCRVCQEAMKSGFGYVTSTPPSDMPPLLASHAPTATSRFRLVNAAFVTSTAAIQEVNPPRPVMRVLVEFDPGSPDAPVRPPRLVERSPRIFSRAVYVPNHRRAGEYLYEISDNSGVRDITIIPDLMLRSRSFQGGPHGTGPIRPVQMFLDIPDEDAKTAAIANRNLRVIVYRIPRTVTDAIITKARWEELKKNPTITFDKVAEMPLPPEK